MIDDTAAWYERREALLRSHADRLYALSLEYARANVFGLVLMDGELHPVPPADRDAMVAALLVQLTDRAERNLAYLAIHRTEPEAATPAERHEARQARKRGL